MDRIERMLEDAGAAWRAGAPSGAIVDPRIFRGRIGGGPYLTIGALALAIAGLAVWRFSGASSEAGQPPCGSTVPTASFVPPSPYPARPGADSPLVWYGDEHLWTFLEPNGQVWHRGVAGAHTFSRKTFWGSVDWSPAAESQPAISVRAEMVDGSSPVSFGPGTNATAEFGTLMLVGVDLPGPGCWRVTGSYRGAELSYVVLAAEQDK